MMLRSEAGGRWAGSQTRYGSSPLRCAGDNSKLRKTDAEAY